MAVDLKLIVPEHMRATVERMAELMQRAANGDRAAKKLLDFAVMYGSGPRKLGDYIASGDGRELSGDRPSQVIRDDPFGEKE